MSKTRNSFENITSTDVNFQRVETKFDQSKRRSLMDGTSLQGGLY